jgi:3-(3-hydroxy-phenyl)propionate hydroxylase
VIDRDVVIVGAGPVGLAAALAVHAHGRQATVIEAGASDRVRPGSRAIFLHNVTLQLLERVRSGLGHELASHGLAWATRRTFYRGREVYRRTYPSTTIQGLPAATSLPQVVTERLLLDACLTAGVEFAWNTPVTGVRADGSGVRVEGERGDIAQAKYVIGADGARSVVRESTGLHLEGPRTANAFVIVDVAEDPARPLPVERVFHYEHPAVDYRNVLFVPFAGHWRVDLQCRKDDDPEAFSSGEGVRQWLSNVMPPHYASRVTWVSTYVFRQAIADCFADSTGRALLAGEAGHVFAPFGARGLNSGVADAVVAARSIDAALQTQGQAAPDCIQAFATHRRAAAERNRAASSTALAHMTARSPLQRVVRRVAGMLAPSVRSVGRWMDKAPYGPPLGPPDSDGMQY